MGAVFLGTPAAAVPALASLAGIEDVDLVITQPDRAMGRSKALVPSPVKVAATQWGLPVAQPEDRASLTELLVSGGHRFGLVVAFGRILTPAMLAATDLGYLNVHFSLLPRWRGAAPVERAIAAGDERTGVTLMRLDEGLDTGPVVGEIATPIGSSETGGSLTARLSYLGASLVDIALPDYLSGRRRPVPQFETETSQAQRLTKEEAQLDPGWSVARAERTIRAFHPRPVAWLDGDDGTVRIHRATPSESDSTPGVVELSGGRVVAGFADGAVELVRVQPSGKPVIEAGAWMHGRRAVPMRFHPPTG